MGTQKNRLNETVLLSTQNMFKLVGKKTITILSSKFFVKLDPCLPIILCDIFRNHRELISKQNGDLKRMQEKEYRECEG